MQAKNQTFDLIISVGLRIIVAAIALLVNRFAYEWFSAELFVALVNVQFALGLAGTIAFPLNRRFWAEYSPSILNQTISATSLVTLLSAPLLVAIAMQLTPQFSNADLPWILAATVIYSIPLAASRYLYGSMVMQEKTSLASFYLLAFSALELTFVSLASHMSESAFLLRFILPGVAFIIIVIPLGKLIGQQHLIPREVFQSRMSISELSALLFKQEGLLTFVVAILMILATMSDRTSLPIYCSSIGAASCGPIADLTLIVVYAGAVATFLSVIIDWLRPKIYFKGAYQVGGLKFMIVALALVMFIWILSVIPGYWIGVRISLIPPTITWSVWMAIFSRYMFYFATTVIQVDLWMTQRPRAILPAMAGFAILLPVTLILTGRTSGLLDALTLAAGLSFAIFVAELFLFWRRWATKAEG